MPLAHCAVDEAERAREVVRKAQAKPKSSIGRRRSRRRLPCSLTASDKHQKHS
jgi:hypothetical protein